MWAINVEVEVALKWVQFCNARAYINLNLDPSVHDVLDDLLGSEGLNEGLSAVSPVSS